MKNKGPEDHQQTIEISDTLSAIRLAEAPIGMEA